MVWCYFIQFCIMYCDWNPVAVFGMFIFFKVLEKQEQRRWYEIDDDNISAMMICKNCNNSYEFGRGCHNCQNEDAIHAGICPTCGDDLDDSGECINNRCTFFCAQIKCKVCNQKIGILGVCH